METTPPSVGAPLAHELSHVLLQMTLPCPAVSGPVLPDLPAGPWTAGLAFSSSLKCPAPAPTPQQPEQRAHEVSSLCVCRNLLLYILNS